MALEVLFGLFDNTLFFVFFIVSLFALIGWITGSFSVGALSGFLMFVNIAVQQDNVLLTNLLYITMIGVLFFTAFKLYNEGLGNDGGASA